MVLLGTGGLAAACGAGSGTTGQLGARNRSVAGVDTRALAYVDCMRTHGEPNMPDPTNQGGGHIDINININSGIHPASPRFTAVSRACRHLVPHGGAARGGRTITPAEQADYRQGVACMRSHGVPAFPDPVFQNGTVTFNAVGSRVNTGSSQYRSALMTCQKLIPAGLRDSGPGDS